MVSESCGLDETQCRCADLRRTGEYHYQRAVMGRTHEEAAALAYKAAHPEADAVAQKLLGRES